MRFVAFLAALLAAPLALSGDVDVLVSAGSPLDWLNDLARPTPTRDRTSPGANEVGHTVVEESPRVFSSDVYRFAKITTVDLIGEIRWTVRPDVATPGRPDVPTPGAGAAKGALPPISDDVLWLGLAVLLRRVLHPALMPESEAEEYLVHLGEPALAACQMARGESLLTNLIASVTKKVGPPTAKPPEIPKGKGALESMLHRLAVEDLTCAFPFAFDGRFARRLSLLGEEGYPYVIEASKSSHLFLRRNATLMLGRYVAPAADERLRELLGDPDPVVQLRAIDALARKRDSKSVPILVDLMKSPDRHLQCSVARALGVIGDPDGIDAVLTFAGGQGFDATVTSLIALSRLANTKRAKDILARVAGIQGRSFSDPKSTYQPVTSDPAGTQSEIVTQLGLLARARLGDKDAARDVVALCSKDRVDDEQRRRRGRGVPSPGRFSVWKAPAVMALVETLARIDKGPDVLYEIAGDEAEDLSVRIRALAELSRVRPPGFEKRFRELATLDRDFAVAQVALRVLAIYAGDLAIEAAQAIVDQYGPTLATPKKATVVEAARVLVQRRKAVPATLLKILEHEMIAAERAPEPPKPADPNDVFRRAQPKLEFETPSTFFEDLIILLGRCEYALARPALREILESPKLRGRAEAIVGLGTQRDLEDAPALVAALDDADGWIRFMAYRALKYMLGKDAPCDWIYGTPADRKAAALRYAQWAREAK